MNVRDSEIVAGLLLDKGFSLTQKSQEADVILFNTCTVRGHAAHRAVSALGALSSKKREGQIFGLIGCLAQDRKEDLFNSVKNLDFICGPAEIYSIPRILEEVRKGKSKIIRVSSNRAPRPLEYVNPEYRDSKTHSFVNISYGCDNFCSYCVVPHVRGKEVSRPVEDIVKEIRSLVFLGIKEITLLGQNVNSYKGPKSEVLSPKSKGKVDFVGLLEMINEIEGLEKISFFTSHPKDAHIELFKAMKDLKKVEKKLHLPFQAGSDRILKLMKRGYTQKHYLNLVQNYRNIVDGQIGTDVMVGFPTETEEDFLETKKVLETVKFNYAYIFKYSPRPHTAAEKLKDDVPKQEKEKRHQELLELQRRISRKKRG